MHSSWILSLKFKLVPLGLVLLGNISELIIAQLNLVLKNLSSQRLIADPAEAEEES